MGAQPGRQEVLDPSPVVQEGHHPVAGAGQGAGRVQRPLEHLVEVQALVDAQAGLTETGEAFLQGLEVPVKLFRLVHFFLPARTPGPLRRGAGLDCIAGQA